MVVPISRQLPAILPALRSSLDPPSIIPIGREFNPPGKMDLRPAKLAIMECTRDDTSSLDAAPAEKVRKNFRRRTKTVLGAS